jgi:site-specific DNA recombinase
MPSAKKTSGDARIAVGYVRASTSEQDLSPQAQRAALERHCREHGLRLVAVFVDQGISGADPASKRPGLLGAFAAVVQHRAGVLLVHRRDRLARDAVLAGLIEREVQRMGAQVHAVEGAANGDTPEAKFHRRMQDVVAEYERDLIGARTKAILAWKRERGERVGQVPYGYRVARDSVRLVEHPGEQKMISHVRRLAARGLSPRAIALRLDADGVRARGKLGWHRTTIQRLLAR